jgi:uncharacterized Fe-S cluster-containing radical SAM superfamily protein
MTHLINKRQPTPTAFTQTRNGNGTLQWSNISYNICKGCDHNCAYCYAKNMAWRFSKGNLNWPTMTVDPKKVAEAAKKFPGVVMFPSSHDITPAILPDCLTTLKNMLSHGSFVLVVSKPHLDVIKTLCKELAVYKEQILFRFTIGSQNATTCQLWEPGAPAPTERIKALKYAYDKGFHTSVSMEPMLGDIPEMIQLVNTVLPFVSDSIWLGKMNSIVIYKNQPANWVTQIKAAKQSLMTAHSDANIMGLVKTLSNNPKIKWKDSIQKVIAAANGTAVKPKPTPPVPMHAPTTVAPLIPAQKPKDPKRQAAAHKAWVTIRAKKAAAAAANGTAVAKPSASSAKGTVDSLLAENAILRNFISELKELIEPAKYEAFKAEKIRQATLLQQQVRSLSTLI